MATNTNVRLKNVLKSFDAIKKHGKLTMLVGGTASPSEGHVQGLCASGGYYILTNSQNDNKKPGYFQVFNKNEDNPSEEQTHVRTVSTEVSDRGHAGGCQEIGSYLVVGIETCKTFEDGGVWLYSIDDLKDHGPRKLRNLVKGSKGCGGAGITEFRRDGKSHWLLAAMDNGDLDFYVSNGKPLEHPECEFSRSFNARMHGEDSSSSTVSLITESEGDIYLVGFVWHETTSEDRAVVYKVDHNSGSIERVRNTHLFTEHGTIKLNTGVHFRYGAGLNLRDEKRFNLYATQRRFLTDESRFAINTFFGE